MSNKHKKTELEIIATKVFIDVKDGVIINLGNGEIIDESDMYYQITPNDGQYICTICSCGYRANICDIGKPNKKCIRNGVYSKEKCAVYSPDPLDISLKSMGVKLIDMAFKVNK